MLRSCPSHTGVPTSQQPATSASTAQAGRTLTLSTARSPTQATSQLRCGPSGQGTLQEVCKHAALVHGPCGIHGSSWERVPVHRSHQNSHVHLLCMKCGHTDSHLFTRTFPATGGIKSIRPSHLTTHTMCSQEYDSGCIDTACAPLQYPSVLRQYFRPSCSTRSKQRSRDHGSVHCMAGKPLCGLPASQDRNETHDPAHASVRPPRQGPCDASTTRSAGLWVSHDPVAGHAAVPADSRVTRAEVSKRPTCHKCHRWPIPYMTDIEHMEV